jgi:hypothetical protein
MTLSAKLRKEACKKYHIGPRQLRNKIKIKRIKDNVADGDVALLLLAQEKGIDVYRPRYEVLGEKLNKLEQHLAYVKATTIYPPIQREKSVSTRLRKAEKLYAEGEQYNVWKDLRSVLRRSKRQVFVVEPHPNEEIFTIYIDSVPTNVGIKILINQPHGIFVEVAKKFALKYSVEIKQSNKIHDRHIFVDNRAWIIGSSIKDAAIKKPTYLIELSNVDPFRSLYESIFSNATLLV